MTTKSWTTSHKITLALSVLFVVVFLWRQWPTRTPAPVVPEYEIVLPGSQLPFFFEKKAELTQDGDLTRAFAKKKKVELMVQELKLAPGQDPIELAQQIVAVDAEAFKADDFILDENGLPSVLLQNHNERLMWIDFYWQEPYLVKAMLMSPSDVAYRDRVVAIRELWPEN